MTLTRDSSHSVKNMTLVELSHHLFQGDSSRVRVSKNRDSSRVELLTQVTLSLLFHFLCFSTRSIDFAFHLMF